MNRASGYSLSAKTRLTMILLLTVTTAVVIVSLLVWRTARAALVDSIEANMLTLNNDRAQQLTDLMTTTQNHITTLSEDEMVVNAMVNFNRQFEDLDGQPIPDEWETAIQTYYTDTFFPRLQENIVGELEYEGYRPGGQAANYVQYHYIVSQADVEQRASVQQADDGSEYSDTHLRYHDRFQRLTESFGYEDLYLIDFETGNVVYSVQKHVDFGTSVVTGPYQRSGLGAMVGAIQSNAARRSVQMVDYARYQPIFTAPAGFAGGPIYNGPHVVGILVVQLPTSEINRITGVHGDQSERHLGSTGESFLVGQDLLMRSDARGFVEDPQTYLTNLRTSLADSQSFESVGSFDTTILLQPVNTQAARAALAGESGVIVQRNALGQETLTAYAPLPLNGLNWAILTEQSLAEAYHPIRSLEGQITIAAVALIAVSGFLTVVQANYFMRPVAHIEKSLEDRQTLEGLERVAKRSDEFGGVAQSAARHLQAQQTQQVELDKLNRTYRRLLTSQLPMGVAPRFDGSINTLWENAAHSTVVGITVVGMLEREHVTQQATATIKRVEQHLHNIASRYDVELFPRGAQSYLAVSGFSNTRPDHIQRAVSFALALLSSLDRLQSASETQIQVQIGIDTGLVIGGVSSERQFIYNLWGAVAHQALSLSHHAAANTVVVTHDVEQAVHELFEFEHVGDDIWLVSDHKATVEEAISE